MRRRIRDHSKALQITIMGPQGQVERARSRACTRVLRIVLREIGDCLRQRASVRVCEALVDRP
jgi:hypothetical protein